MRPKKPKRPTEAQTRILARIAAAGGALCMTRDPNGKRYHDQAGRTVPEPTAMALIHNGWVIAQRDSMYDLDPQTWLIQKP